MIILSEIVTKLNEILNANDNPLSTTFPFVVESPGFHLDSVADHDTRKNFIPVFISSLGGTINPVPLLKQTDATIPMVFYFPVRYKSDFFNLNDWLVDKFCGKTMDWGDISGKAISNVSLPRYGEIQDLDLIQFKKWTEANFNREIEVMEPFMSMEISLFLSTANSQFIYGNNVYITNLSVYYGGNLILSDDEPICIDRADIGSSEPAAQQLFSDTYSRGFPANAAYTKQIPLIIKNQHGYYELLEKCEKDKDLQKLTVKITESIPLSKFIYDSVAGKWVVDKDTDNKPITSLEVTHTYYVTNYSRRTSLGQLLGISLTLADLREEDEEEDNTEEVVE